MNIMETIKEENDTEGSYTAKDGDKDIDLMTYSLANVGNLSVVDHTAVANKFNGITVGKKLIERLVDEVRKAEMSVKLKNENSIQ